jgi:hypothetical protein
MCGTSPANPNHGRCPDPIRSRTPTAISRWRLAIVSRLPRADLDRPNDRCPSRGRLYIGYGDYQDNTGPIDGALYVGTQDAELYRLVGWP